MLQYAQFLVSLASLLID